MQLKVNKTRVSSFGRKTDWHDFYYKMCESSVANSDCNKDLGVLTDTKLHFHQKVDEIFSPIIRLLGVNSTCDFLLFLTAQPSGAIFHISQTQVVLCLCCVEFCHF
jgi:hypothetical protein